jgi:hypothetical protein
MTLHVFPVDRGRIRALVPARYQLGDYTGTDWATLALWVISCDAMRFGRERPRPVTLSLLGVQVRAPLSPGTPDSPALFAHYLLFAHSDDQRLVDRLRAIGLPASLVPGMQFHRAATTTIRVPWRSGAYEVSVRGFGSEAPHDHDNSYWYDGPKGTSRLQIRFYGATDRACFQCSAGILTPAGSPIARLLGATSTRPYLAVDHNKIAVGDATLLPPQELAFAAPGPIGSGFIGIEGVATKQRAVVSQVAGVLVTDAISGEPAQRAGIRDGDVVLALNGTPVHTLAELGTQTRRIQPGSQATLTILRQRARKTITLTVAERTN